MFLSVFLFYSYFLLLDWFVLSVARFNLHSCKLYCLVMHFEQYLLLFILFFSTVIQICIPEKFVTIFYLKSILFLAYKYLNIIYNLSLFYRILLMILSDNLNNISGMLENCLKCI